MPFKDPEAKRRYDAEWRKLHLAYKHERDRAYKLRVKHDPRFKATRRAEAARHRAENPQKIIARNAVNNGIRDGRLVRLPCEVCGSWAEAHHEDYDKPLEVKWLCPKHHKEV